MYHLSHPTPQLMKQAAQRFASGGLWNLAQFCFDKAIEEQDHDRLALLDIESMGYQGDPLVKAVIPPGAARLVDYFKRSVQLSIPIGCFGYSYLMERIALGIGKNQIQEVELMLPQGTQATRTLRVHSSIGSDANHVEATLALVSQLSSGQQIHIANACYETALLCFNPPKRVSEDELHSLFQPFKQRG